ncbi:MAG: endolytic transglycosylase MltG [Patescibacteria group bacterium]
MTFLQLFTTIRQILGLHFARFWLRYVLLGSLTTVLCIVFVLFCFIPKDFPEGAVITIQPGESVLHAARDTRRAHLISSSVVFRTLVRFTPGNHGVLAGTYVFPKRVGMLTVAWHMSQGISGAPRARLTFPEGSTTRQMGELLAEALPGFPKDVFLTSAIPYEGFLFPDTYYFAPGTTPEEALSLLRTTYDRKTEPLKKMFVDFGKSERDIVIMASLLEAEGKTPDDRRIIAGILWKRIELKMPLQVDASFGYDYGLTGYVPTAKDLQGNSAYNTYRYRGLPPTPINNPGTETLKAASTPTKTQYLYYLTGTDEKMHYAKTFAEHVQNKKKYLQ